MHGSLFGLPVSGYAFAIVAYLALAVRCWPRASENAQGSSATTVMFIASLVSVAWAVLSLLAFELSGVAVSVFSATFDALRYGAWLAFLTLLLRPAHRSGPAWWQGRYLAATAALVATSVCLHVVAAGVQTDGLALRAALIVPLTLAALGLVLIEQLFRNMAVDSRWAIKPLCLGLCCIFGFDLYVYSEAALFSRFDDDAVNVRALVHAFAVPLLFVATQRNTNWVGRLQVSRAAAFHSVALLLTGLYLLFISAIGYYVRYFGGTWGRSLQLGTLAIALLALAAVLLSGSMRAKLRVILSKHFFSYRYDYRREWLRFTATLSSSKSPQATGGLVVRGLADMLESPAGGLWYSPTSDGEFAASAQWNLPQQAHREPCNSPFSTFLLETGWIIDLDECRARPLHDDGRPEVPAWLLTNPQFWLVVPLLAGDELIGFVVLTHARTPIDVNWEVTDLLKTASRQAASFLAQMRATEALLEARKFDSFNRMSAFVVHDLKNIVTQLSLMMKNAARLRDNPEFHADMLMTIENSLDKMRQLMLQLREGEAPAGSVSGVALLPILRRIEASARGRDRVLELQVQDRAVTRGHEERIERVLGHVVQNAFDATPLSGTVTVTLERAAGRAKVVVRDTGDGMSPEFVQTRLFKPFQTTKTNGMGIGAYESFQYIRELGGSISVDSQVGAGTTVTILMPLFDSRQTSDLQMQGES